MNKLEGVITNWNADKGYGFIAVGEENYFFHATSLPGNIERERLVGKIVSFLPVQKPKGKAAMNVEFGKGAWEGDDE